MTTDAHIASVLVRARPERAAHVAARIAAQADSEVYAVEEGKIVVVLEAQSERALAERMDELRGEPDVLFVNLVFHQVDGQADEK
jgi:periplasmic nitrate reductase NapD